jgi:hypothetical protein
MATLTKATRCAQRNTLLAAKTSVAKRKLIIYKSE